MELRQRLRRALEFSRGFTERLLGDFKTPQEWVTPGVDGANHALWIAGHLAVADDAFTTMMAPAHRTKCRIPSTIRPRFRTDCGGRSL